MEACLRGLDAQDFAQMGKSGARLKGHSDPGFAALYEAAQRAWLSFRDREARTFESRGGSGFASIFVSCLLEINDARLAHLKESADAP